MFKVKETNLVTKETYMVKRVKHTSRGWVCVNKEFKTESAAKAWITRRMKELAGTSNEGVFAYEVVSK